MRYNFVTKGHGPCLVDSSMDGDVLNVLIWWGRANAAGQYEHSTGYVAPLVPFQESAQMSTIEQATRFVIAQFEITKAKPVTGVEITLAGDPILWMGALVQVA